MSSHAIDAEAQQRRLRRALEGVIGVPATEGNAVTVLRNGDEIFPAMLDAIGTAQHTIDLLTFVYWEGKIGTEFAEALAERARAGVRVRVLLDALGARTMERALIALLEENGVCVRWFRPLRRFRPAEMNHRTHRKVMIVDEAIGFTGGVGIADEWQGNARDKTEWRDTHFQISGPAVDGLRAAFLDNWAETDPDLFDESVDRFPEQPQTGDSVLQCVRGAAETGSSDVATLTRSLIQLAQRRIRLTSAYFVPDDELLGRLFAAAERGVEIEILLPGPHADKRFVQLAGEAVFAPLLERGVRIWTFQPSMLHAKVMTVDGLLANVGSANLDNRSAALDEEINLVVLDPAVVDVLDRQFDEDLERSVQLDPSRWDDRTLGQRAAERLVGPIKKLF